MKYESVIQDAEDVLAVILNLDLNAEDIDALKQSVHHAICYGHISPLDGSVFLSVLNNY